jgi:hypothetical protein
VRQPRRLDGLLKIEVFDSIRSEPRIKRRGALSPRRLDFIGRKRPFDDVGDRPILAASEPMGQFASPRAAYRQLRLSHVFPPMVEGMIPDGDLAIKLASDV